MLNSKKDTARATGTAMEPVGSGPILIDQVYQRILESIADCTLLPGQRIRQGKLAESLGVSRQPVSHALHLLKRQGLVRETGRQGLEVVPIDPVRIRQLYEVRGALDGAAARLAASRSARDHRGRAALEKRLTAGLKTTSETTLPALIRLDTEFHLALYGLSGNPSFEEIVEPHWPHLRRSMATVLAAPDYRARAWAEHAAITERVLEGDEVGAEQLAREHAINAGLTTEERMGSVPSAA
jgi:DNA-binding GntR family transcriptional regulator